MDEKVDAVFPNAVFHWIKEENQDKMLHCVYSALRDEGQFAFEFGGEGNNQLIHSAMLERADADSMIRDAVSRLERELCVDGVWYADYVRIRGKAVIGRKASLANA